VTLSGACFAGEEVLEKEKIIQVGGKILFLFTTCYLTNSIIMEGKSANSSFKLQLPA